MRLETPSVPQEATQQVPVEDRIIRDATSRTARVFSLTLLVVSICGCNIEVGEKELARHPIVDSLSIDPAGAIRISRSPVAHGPLASFGERLNARHSPVMIGILEGESEYLLGQVGGGAFLGDGFLAVLDQQVRLIRVYDPRGIHVQTLGGPGEGPGELNAPMAVVAAGPSELWVVDGARMIHRFSVVQGRLAFHDRITLESFPRDACAVGESIILHAPGHMPDAGASDVLFRLDRHGAPEAQFAAPYRYHHFLAADRMRRGSVACAGYDLVLLGFEAQNRLDGYRISDGELVWHATFDSLRIPAVREAQLPDGRRSLEVDWQREPVTHFLLGMSGGGELPVLIQYGRRLREDILEGRNRYAVETFIVDPPTGQGMYLGDELAQILAINTHRVALLHPEPFPRVEVATLGAVSRP
jgi:hypothetical protein